MFPVSTGLATQPNLHVVAFTSRQTYIHLKMCRIKLHLNSTNLRIRHFPRFTNFSFYELFPFKPKPCKGTPLKETNKVWWFPSKKLGMLQVPHLSQLVLELHLEACSNLRPALELRKPTGQLRYGQPARQIWGGTGTLEMLRLSPWPWVSAGDGWVGSLDQREVRIGMKWNEDVWGSLAFS